jgi:N-acetylglutamate synthase-like GNAT family acetyltransferase
VDLDFNQLLGETVVGEAHLTDTGVNLVNLDSIQVTDPQRGNGYGSQLLDQVAAAAAAEGVTVTLTCAPTEGSPFSAKTLCKWFGRHGWISSDDDLYQMSREPA